MRLVGESEWAEVPVTELLWLLRPLCASGRVQGVQTELPRGVAIRGLGSWAARVAGRVTGALREAGACLVKYTIALNGSIIYY